ncbi:hypothetical protein E4U55_007009 [Claviceps digitariae]|nr:hypothetical protein E4U55_007009 [Claviceps digitariae]
MGCNENDGALDATTLPGVGQRSHHEYRQTVPIEEELDMPPSYEEASSGATQGMEGARRQTADRTKSSPSSATATSAAVESSRNGDDGSEDEHAKATLLAHDAHAEPQVREQQHHRPHTDAARHQGRPPSGYRSLFHEQIDDHGSIDGGSTGVDTTGYKATDPLYWQDQARKGTWDTYREAGCCGSTTGGCFFSSRGGCCFSDRGGCLCSDRRGCCFSDRGGCFFSDLGGGCFSTGDACCCGEGASHDGEERVWL